MKLRNDPAFPFTHVSPIYNWIYPLSWTGAPFRYAGQSIADAVGADGAGARSRALYLHVPFCETICSFCPLLKGPLPNSEALDVYVQALLAEIAWKGGDRELTRLPIRAIFFGGGTPSLLCPDHILAIGRALRSEFDLSAVEEFSVEMEVKSIAPAALEAFAQIGVTHARFGVQTFTIHHRNALHLTATLDQIYNAASVLPHYFRYVSCDILYGFNGQTSEEFFDDVELAVGLKLNNIEFYPLNTVVVQRRMHRNYERRGLRPLSAMSKLYMGRALRSILEDHSFLPHNGHGYVKVPNENLKRGTIVTDAYSFKYHQHVYGSCKDEFIGLGNGAQTYLAGHTIENNSSRERYVKSLLDDREHIVRLKRHPTHVNAAKSIAISLPYFGSISRASIDWEAIPPYLMSRLDDLCTHDLLSIDDNSISLTIEGWYWYTNIMYYLSPSEEQAELSKLIMGAEERRLQSEPIDSLTLAI